MVHLWVEGFFEVCATVTIAFFFSRLRLVYPDSAAAACLFSTAVFLSGGILGTFHHLYFARPPAVVMALGAVFSALEVVPRALIGSNTRTLQHKTRRHTMFPIRTILHPTDFSVHSEHAYRLACSLARDHGARLVALHVVSGLAAGEVVWDLFQPAEGYKEAMEKKLHNLATPDSGVPIECQLKEGDPAKQILRVAQETNCDLIVMGTHGRTGLDRFLLGSVAEEVVRKAPCAVLTMKIPQAHALPSWELSQGEGEKRPPAPTT